MRNKNEQDCMELVVNDFIPHKSKQFVLVDILKTYTPLTHVELAKLVDVSAEKLISVQLQQDFLTNKQSKMLLDFFCVWCVD